jgi:hypothetical protein
MKRWQNAIVYCVIANTVQCVLHQIPFIRKKILEFLSN